MNEYNIYECPYCNENIIIYKNEINCGIFRHAIDKITFKQIDPHTPKNICDNLFENNKVFGCCKPFQIINNQIRKCDYI